MNVVFVLLHDRILEGIFATKEGAEKAIDLQAYVPVARCQCRTGHDQNGSFWRYSNPENMHVWTIEERVVVS